jgi:hypothetical protein
MTPLVQMCKAHKKPSAKACRRHIGYFAYNFGRTVVIMDGPSTNRTLCRQLCKNGCRHGRVVSKLEQIPRDTLGLRMAVSTERSPVPPPICWLAVDRQRQLYPSAYNICHGRRSIPCSESPANPIYTSGACGLVASTSPHNYPILVISMHQTHTCTFSMQNLRIRPIPMLKLRIRPIPILKGCPSSFCSHNALSGGLRVVAVL